jgi:hypothetical protein
MRFSPSAAETISEGITLFRGERRYTEPTPTLVERGHHEHLQGMKMQT